MVEKNGNQENAVVEESVSDADASAATVDVAAARLAQMEAELAEARAQAADAVDKAQRMAAEFQNSRKRQDKHVAEAIDRAGAHLVRRLLPIVDDFDLAFANVPDGIDAAAWVTGFQQIQKKLHALLQEDGVTPIPAQGEFDPTLHEAIGSEANDSVPSGDIVSLVRAGYSMKGQVLRPALVRVAL